MTCRNKSVTSFIHMVIVYNSCRKDWLKKLISFRLSKISKYRLKCSSIYIIKIRNFRVDIFWLSLVHLIKKLTLSFLWRNGCVGKDFLELVSGNSLTWPCYVKSFDMMDTITGDFFLFHLPHYLLNATKRGKTKH